MSHSFVPPLCRPGSPCVCASTVPSLSLLLSEPTPLRPLPSQ
ncbi:hypothetical protein GYH30_001152 [Glycine max]|nr:hypothetical protein GYH30_001152 [Glycine max]